MWSSQRPLAWFDGRRRPVADLAVFLGDVGEHPVDAELWALGEGSLAQRAGVDGAGRPVAPDAALAEVVPAGRGDRLAEQVQTDGAGQLLLRQHIRTQLSHTDPYCNSHSRLHGEQEHTNTQVRGAEPSPG